MGTRGLLPDELAPVVGLGDELVAGRRVHDDVRAADRETGRWRIGRPEVFADLDSKQDRASTKEQVGVYRERFEARQGHRGIDAETRGEPASFVELAGIGQVLLGDGADHPAGVEYCRRIDLATVGQAEGQADDDGGIECGGRPGERRQRRFGLLAQSVGEEEVLARVSGEGELGEADEGGAVGRQARRPTGDFGRICRRVAQVDLRGRHRDPHKPKRSPVRHHEPDATFATPEVSGGREVAPKDWGKTPPNSAGRRSAVFAAGVPSTVMSSRPGVARPRPAIVSPLCAHSAVVRSPVVRSPVVRSAVVRSPCVHLPGFHVPCVRSAGVRSPLVHLRCVQFPSVHVPCVGPTRAGTVLGRRGA